PTCLAPVRRLSDRSSAPSRRAIMSSPSSMRRPARRVPARVRSATARESSTGSTTSSSKSVKNEFSLSFERKIGSKENNVSIGGSFEWDKSKTDGTATEIKKTNKSTIAVSGPAIDGIDHDHDIIYLWLNPKITISILQSAKKVSWTFDGSETCGYPASFC